VVTGEEMELPVHLTRWQRWDWALAVLAALGLGLFFPFFQRTSLAPRSKLSFDRSVLRRIAQEYAERLGAPIGKRAEIGAVNLFPRYEYLAETAGARVALELTSNPVPYWLCYVEWENYTHVAVDNRGSLVHFSRDFAPGVAGEKLSVEVAKPMAEKAVREFFGRDPSQLALDSAAIASWSDRPATSFRWTDPTDWHGVKRRYSVQLVGQEVAELEEVYDPPYGYVSPSAAWQLLACSALTLALLYLGFSFRRMVDLNARWRIVHSTLVDALGAWAGWLSAPHLPRGIMAATSGALALALGGFFTSIVLERFVRRFAAVKLASYVQSLSRQIASEPCGVAFVRGTLVGLALLGLDAFLVWAATVHLGGRLDTNFHIGAQVRAFLVSPFPAFHLVLWALLHAMAAGVLLAILVSVVGRLVRRPWLAVGLAAALAAVTLPGPILSLGTVQPYALKVFVLFIDCLALGWAFTRYDVLTLQAGTPRRCRRVDHFWGLGPGRPGCGGDCISIFSARSLPAAGNRLRMRCPPAGSYLFPCRLGAFVPKCRNDEGRDCARPRRSVGRIRQACV
jgi:hypothetical protein